MAAVAAALPVDRAACEVVARAWDSAAATQPEHAASVWNPKGYVNNSWARVVSSPAGTERARVAQLVALVRRSRAS